MASKQTIEELQVLISANADQFKGEFLKLNSELAKLSSNAGTAGKNVDKTLVPSMGRANIAAIAIGTAIGSLVASAFRTLTSSVGDAVTRLDTLKNYPRVMQSLGYSTNDAQKSIQLLTDRIQGLPTTLNEIVQATQQLAPVSNGLAAATYRAIALNDAFLASGASADQVSQAMVQFNQMLATGKADMQSWNSVVMTMPGQMQQVAKSMLGASGTTQKLHDKIVAGTISTQQLADEFVKLDKQGLAGFGSFEQQARNATGGIATSITNVKTAITRGLANIMDAIGQANIAGFFQRVASAINAVVPYVVAFVRVVMMAVSAVSSFFGGSKKSTDSMAKSTGSAATSTGKVATNAKAASGALDDAASSAKKLHQQLASFDEMNVITQDKSAGSGNAGGVGSAMNFGLDGINTSPLDKVQGIVDKILGTARMIGDAFKTFFNLAPVTEFFGQLMGFWNQIQPNIIGAVSNFVYLFTSMWQQLLKTIDVYAPQIGSNIAKLFVAIVNDDIGPNLVMASKMWFDWTEDLVKVWDEHGASIFNGVGELLTNITGIFLKLWTDIMAPIIKPFLAEFSKTWSESINPMIQKALEFVAVLVDSALQILNKFVIPIISWLIDKLAPVFIAIGTLIGGVFNSVIRVISDVVGSIFTILTGLINFITGVFTGQWGKAWDGVKQVLSGVFDGFVAIIKFPLNLIIDGINAFTAGLNALKIPDWVPAIGGKGFNIARIPKLATGGITNGSTIANIGENGREAVLPLENNTGWMDKLAEKIGGGAPTVVQLVMDGQKVGEVVVNYINDRAKTTNGQVLRI